MATVACPGCGLPRTESEVGATPCPLCAATSAGGSTPPRARKKAAADPTDGLPADASELNAPGARFPASAESGSRAPLVIGVFLLGALCGIGGVLVVQFLDRPKTVEPEVAAKPEIAPGGGLAAPGIAVAPMPHEPVARPIVLEPDPVPEPNPDFKLVQPPPPPGRVTTFDLGQQPELLFAAQQRDFGRARGFIHGETLGLL